MSVPDITAKEKEKGASLRNEMDTTASLVQTVLKRRSIAFDFAVQIPQKSWLPRARNPLPSRFLGAAYAMSVPGFAYRACRTIAEANLAVAFESLAPGRSIAHFSTGDRIANASLSQYRKEK
eukprot:2342151-Rhodomonas_salina.2